MLRALGMAASIVSIGLWFAYIHHFSILMRRRLELDERFCDLAEDLESAVLSVQVDVVNLQQSVNEALKKRG